MGSKESGSQKTYDYHATVAWGIASGPVDWLDGIIFDGAEVYAGHITRGAEHYINLAVDAKWTAKRGFLRFFWGTTGQLPEAMLFMEGEAGYPSRVPHSPYRGTAYLVGHQLLFGREKTQPPNVEVICGRKPVPYPGTCDDADNVEHDGRVNPVAVASELISSQRVLQRGDLMDPATWTAAAHWAYLNREVVFVSTLLNEAQDVRATLRSLMEMVHGVFYWTKAGKLGLRVVELGVEPGAGTKVIDQFQILSPARLALDGWRSAATSVRARYPDRLRKYKETLGSRLENPHARRLSVTPNDVTLDLQHVTNEATANAVAADRLKMMVQPASRVALRIRRTLALGLEPGDRVRVDVDPDPGGDGNLQAGVVGSVRLGSGATDGEVEVILDPTVAPKPYTPDHGPKNPGFPPVGLLTQGLVIPLPTVAYGAPPALGVLTTRLSTQTVGFHVAFSRTEDSGYAGLGDQPGFALRLIPPLTGALGTGGGTDATPPGTTLTVGLADGEDCPDEYFLQRVPANGLEAQLDGLLLIIVQLAAAVSGGTGVVAATITFAGGKADGTASGTGLANGNLFAGPLPGEWFLYVSALDLTLPLRATWTQTAGATPTTLTYSSVSPGAGYSIVRLVSSPAEPPAGTVGSLSLLQGGTVSAFGGTIASDPETGLPLMEICSVTTAVVTADPAVWDLTFLRARMGTRMRTWDWAPGGTPDAKLKVWLVPGDNIVPWRHPDFSSLLFGGVTGYLALTSFSSWGDAESALVLPAKIPAGMHPAPVITWTLPATDPIIDSGAGVTFQIDVKDADGDLVRIALYSTNMETGSTTLIKEVSVSVLSEGQLNATQSFPVGTHELAVEAVDALSNIARTRKTAFRSGSGSTMAPPTMTPPSGTHFENIIHVAVVGTGACTHIHWAFGGDVPPATWGTLTGATQSIAIGQASRKLWVRAATGTSATGASVWVNGNYIYSGDPWIPPGQHPP